MKYIYIAFITITLLACEKEQTIGVINETFWVKNAEANMPVYVRGNIDSKVVILIVHGGPGGSGLEYRAGLWTEQLEKNYAMAYWDQRGQGMSHGHYDESDVTVAQMTEDMDAVIKVLKAKYGDDVSVFALGHSWGGTLSANYMVTGDLQYNLKGWIEASGAHDNPKGNMESVKLYIQVANEQIAAGNSVAKWQDILEWASAIDTNNITGDQSSEINQKGYEVESWLTDDGILVVAQSGGNENSMFFGPTNFFTSNQTGNRTNYMLDQEVEKIALTDQLFRITIPVLVIWGKYDFVVAPALGEDTYNNISSSVKKIVTLEKSGHSIMDFEWQEFANEIQLFVETNK
jgi:pimeloyl-ACP methyl ester carboxylesterase